MFTRISYSNQLNNGNGIMIQSKKKKEDKTWTLLCTFDNLIRVKIVQLKKGEREKTKTIILPVIKELLATSKRKTLFLLFLLLFRDIKERAYVTRFEWKRRYY